MRKIICPICGESTNEGKFCSECGALLKQEQPKEKVEEKNKLSNNGLGSLLDKVNLNSAVDEVLNTYLMT